VLERPAWQRLAFLAVVEQPGERQGQATGAQNRAQVRSGSGFLDRFESKLTQVIRSRSRHCGLRTEQEHTRRFFR
jgi:hypothetical protein